MAATEHVLRVGRVRLGQQTYGYLRGAAGMRYGTTGRCSCRGWKVQRNVAPSSGGRKEVEQAFQDHLADLAKIKQAQDT